MKEELTWIRVMHPVCIMSQGPSFEKRKELLCLKLYFDVLSALALRLLLRRSKNKRRAEEVSEKLRDNRDLQHFLQNTQDVSFFFSLLFMQP